MRITALASSARRSHLVLTLWLSAALSLVITLLLPQLHGAIRLTLVVYASLVVPGVLIAGVLNWWTRHNLVAIVAGGFGFGLATVMIGAAVLLRLKLPVVSALLWMLFVAIVTGLWLIVKTHPFPHRDENLNAVPQRHSEPLFAYTLLLLLLTAVVFTVLSFHFKIMPDYPTGVRWDKNNYVFATTLYAGDIDNLRIHVVDRDRLRPSIQRVTWSSWLYSEAMLSEVSAVAILTAQTRDLHPVLMGAALVIFYALAHHLFRRHIIALFAVLMQLYVVTQSDLAEFFIYRLEEDKWLALFILVPFAMWVTMDTMTQRNPRAYIALTLAVAGLALVHPLGIPALLLIAFPYVVASEAVHFIVERKAIRWRSTLVILVILLLGLAGPLFEAQQVRSISRSLGNQRTPGGTNSNFGYTAPFGGIERDPILLGGLLITFLTIPFAFKDRAARYVLVGSAVLYIIMYTAPGAFIGVRLVTRAQLWRLIMVIPFALAWAWLLYRIYRLHERFTPPRRMMLVGNGIVLFVTVVMFVWMQNHQGKNVWGWLVPFSLRPQIAAAPPDVWQGMEAAASIVDDGLVVVAPQWSEISPYVFPRAHFIVYAKAGNIGDNAAWQTITALYEAPDDAHFAALVTNYAPDYLVVDAGSPLDDYLQNRGVRLAHDSHGQRVYALPKSLNKSHHKAEVVGFMTSQAVTLALSSA